MLESEDEIRVLQALIDRTFARERFALAAAPIDDRGDCFNCRIPPGDGIRLRTLKDFAFTVAGTEAEAHAREGGVAQVTIADARAAGAWRTVVAPPGEHRPLHAVGTATIEELLRRCRDEITVARDAGVTEFLAKPISAKGLYQRILNVVANPRPFIKTKTYFGPDRRRNTSNAYIGPERRVGGEMEVLQQPSLLDKARTSV